MNELPNEAQDKQELNQPVQKSFLNTAFNSARGKKLFAGIVIMLGAVVAISAGAAFYAYQKSGGISGGEQACTLEAKICPDGSAVGRTGPNCEFALCPSEALCEGGECPGEDNTQAIDTSDWNTYRNDEYGFEIKYPDNYLSKEIDNQVWFRRDDIQDSLGWRTDSSRSSDLTLYLRPDLNELRSMFALQNTVLFSDEYFLAVENHWNPALTTYLGKTTIADGSIFKLVHSEHGTRIGAIVTNDDVPLLMLVGSSPEQLHYPDTNEPRLLDSFVMERARSIEPFNQMISTFKFLPSTELKTGE